MMIKTVLFDLGNVLLFFSHEKMASQLAKLFHVSPQQIQETIFETPLLLQTETGEVEEDELIELLENKFGTKVSKSDFQNASADIFTVNTPMIPILEALKKKQIRLVLMSNTCSTHVNFVKQKYSFLSLFDHLVLSYEVGACKPDDRIFEEAKKQIACEPSECFYTDDISKFITTSHQHGFQAETFVGADDFRNHLKNRGLEL